MTDLIICLVLGFISFILAQIISISQIVSLIKTKNTSGVSVWTYVIFVLAGSICLLWGFSYYYQEMRIEGSTSIPYWLYQWAILPIICYYITDFCLSSTMLVIKARHIRLSKKLKMSELDLAKYLKQQQERKYKKTHKIIYTDWFKISVILGCLFTFVILFAVLFTLLVDWHIMPADQPITYSLPWVMPASITAALLWELISWPQFIKSLRVKDTSGISMGWAIFMPISLTFSFCYALSLALKGGGFSYDTIGGLVFNGMIVNYAILVMKLINRRNAKKRHMTEVEYTKKILIPQYEKKVKAKPKNLTKEQKAELKQKKLIAKALEAKKMARAISLEKDAIWKEQH